MERKIEATLSQIKATKLNRKFFEGFFREFSTTNPPISKILIDLAVLYYDQQYLVDLMKKKGKLARPKFLFCATLVPSIIARVKNILEEGFNGIRPFFSSN